MEAELGARAATQLLRRLGEAGLLGTTACAGPGVATVRTEGPDGPEWTRVLSVEDIPPRLRGAPAEVTLGFDTLALRDPRPLNAKLVALCAMPYVGEASARFWDGHLAGITYDMKAQAVLEAHLDMGCTGTATFSVAAFVKHSILRRAAALEGVLGRDAALEVTLRSFGR